MDEFPNPERFILPKRVHRHRLPVVAAMIWRRLVHRKPRIMPPDPTPYGREVRRVMMDRRIGVRDVSFIPGDSYAILVEYAPGLRAVAHDGVKQYVDRLWWDHFGSVEANRDV